MNENLTPQEIFDKALKGIIAQGRPARADDGTCRYRSFDGRKCAVGMLVDDETGRRWDHSGGIMDVILKARKRGETLPVWVTANSELLASIQECHDSLDDDVHFVERFIENMRNIAPQYQLTPPDLTT